MKEEEELVEKDIRERFKKMCEGYFDNVSKKLVIEHKVSVAHCRLFQIYIISSTAFARTRSPKS